MSHIPEHHTAPNDTPEQRRARRNRQIAIIATIVVLAVAVVLHLTGVVGPGR